MLIVLGLDRSSSLSHYLAANTVATLMSLCYATLRHSSPVGAPIAEPQMTLRQIRDECAPLLPGARIQRHALLRYSLLWVKPAST